MAQPSLFLDVLLLAHLLCWIDFSSIIRSASMMTGHEALRPCKKVFFNENQLPYLITEI